MNTRDEIKPEKLVAYFVVTVLAMNCVVQQAAEHWLGTTRSMKPVMNFIFLLAAVLPATTIMIVIFADFLREHSLPTIKRPLLVAPVFLFSICFLFFVETWHFERQAPWYTFSFGLILPLPVCFFLMLRMEKSKRKWLETNRGEIPGGD